MRLTFHGAARTVTGSQHLVEVNGTRILLDCGLYQGKRSESYDRNRHLPFKPETVDVMVLSHAHIDHAGNIPNLVKSGFRGDIISTYATRDLSASMLLDSGFIQERDIEYVNKKRLRKGEMPFKPLYTREDAKDSLNYFITQAYHRRRTIAPGVQLTFLDAGHMLGSAIVVLDIEDHETKRDVRLVFSGDLGRQGIPIIRDPEFVESADVLIIESTYGNRVHPSYEGENERLKQIIVDAYKRGGVILIPAFAVGRTQQLILTLHQLTAAGDIPRLPVYVDSPLATDVTGVYRQHPECYDDEIMAFITEGNGRRDPFGFSDLTYTRSVEESKQLNFLREPAIIISASGMMENGRILHHLKNHIDNPKTTILVVSWQAEHTLGRRIVDRAPEVRIFGEPYRNNAHVEVLNGFSGHADRDELIDWVGEMNSKPRRTFLVHGEYEGQVSLAKDLEDKLGLTVDIPDMQESFDV